MGVANTMGQPTSGTGQVGGVGMGQQPTAQPGAKGGTGSNVPAGKGGNSVTGGQQAVSNNYPAYNPQQNTYGAMGSTNVYNPVSANMQQPQFQQSTLQLPQGGFQPNYGMYNNQPPMPGGGLIPNMGNQANINYAPQKPLNAGYAGLAPQTGATMFPGPSGLSQPQQGAFNFENIAKANPNINPTEITDLQGMSGPAYAQQLAKLQGMGVRGIPNTNPLAAPQGLTQGLPQNAGQMPKPPMQQQIGQPNQRQQMQRFMQQFRPNRNNR